MILEWAQAHWVFLVSAIAITLVSFGISSLISASRSTVLKINVALIFSFTTYMVGVQVLDIDFAAVPINFIFVALPVIVAPLARTGLSAELSWVTPVVDQASNLIQTLVLEPNSVVRRTRGEALQTEIDLTDSPRGGHGKRRSATSDGSGGGHNRRRGRRRGRSSGMLFGRSSAKAPPVVSPLRLMWIIMAAVTFTYLRTANLLEPRLSTLLGWVACTLIILVIERQLHLKSRFVDVATTGRDRVRRAYRRRFQFQLGKRDAPDVDASR